MAKKKTPTLSRDEIERWLELDAERLAANRKASDLEKQQKAIGKKLLAYAEATTEDGVTASRCGYVIVIDSKRVNVQWKDKFIALTSIEEAEKILAAQPVKKSAFVQKPE